MVSRPIRGLLIYLVYGNWYYICYLIKNAKIFSNMSFEYKQLTTFGFTLTIWVGLGVPEMYVCIIKYDD